MSKTVTPPVLTRHWRRTAFVVTVALLPSVAAVVAGVWVSEPDPCRAGAVTATATGSTDGSRSPQPVPAHEPLARMAGSITAAPQEVSAGFAFHHLRRWILDTTGTPAPPGICENTPAAFAIDIRRWEAADGSGRGIEVENPPDYTLTAANPGHRSTDAEFTTGTTKRTDYPAGNQRSLITAPLATEPAALAAQLAAVDPMPDGPQATIRAVDELYASFHVDLPVRRAALQVLANLDGLSFRGDGSPRSHRRSGRPHRNWCRVHARLRPDHRSTAGLAATLDRRPRVPDGAARPGPLPHPVHRAGPPAGTELKDGAAMPTTLIPDIAQASTCTVPLLRFPTCPERPPVPPGRDDPNVAPWRAGWCAAARHASRRGGAPPQRTSTAGRWCR